MFCDEAIINVFFLKRQFCIKGEDCLFDCFYDIAFHTTKGFGLILETLNYMISIGADGVKLTDKKEFHLNDNERLQETVEEFEDETIVDFKNTLFVGQRLLSVEKTEEYSVLAFDDFSLKLFTYELGKMDKSFRSADPWSYSHVLGFDRFIKAKCPLCGGDGEVLLDFVQDFVVRCKQCKKSTYAEMQIKDVIESWNKSEVQCDLSDITIE